VPGGWRKAPSRHAVRIRIEGCRRSRWLVVRTRTAAENVFALNGGDREREGTTTGAHGPSLVRVQRFAAEVASRGSRARARQSFESAIAKRPATRTGPSRNQAAPLRDKNSIVLSMGERPAAVAESRAFNVVPSADVGRTHTRIVSKCVAHVGPATRVTCREPGSPCCRELNRG